MPTGYTAAIEKGIDFKTFVMRCARAMGACVTMRDEPGNAPIPEKFEPSTYERERVEKAREKLAELRKMTPAKARGMAQEEWTRHEQQRQEFIAKAQKLLGQYQAMLLKVRAWRPPTPEHKGLRDFMIEQLNTSIDGDCQTHYWKREPEPDAPESWLAQRIAAAEKELADAERGLREELARVENRNAWIRQLRESLESMP